MIALLASAALAEDPAEMKLDEAVLGEAIDLDLSGAIRTYRELSRNLPVESPVRSEALYRLGLALGAVGRVGEAREALTDGIRGECYPCRLALEDLEIEQHAVGELPTVWTFDAPGHGVFHPIDAQDLGSMRLETHDGRPALEWQTGGRAGEDRLVIGLASGARELRILATSEGQPGQLGVRVEDDRNRRYGTTEPLVFEADHWQWVVVDLGGLTALEPDEPRPDPAHLVRVELLDRTGPRRLGSVTWWIDQVEIR